MQILAHELVCYANTNHAVDELVCKYKFMQMMSLYANTTSCR